MSGSIKTHNNFKTFCMKLSPGWSACKERTNARTQTTTRTRLNNTFPCPPFIKIIIIKTVQLILLQNDSTLLRLPPPLKWNCHKVWATNFKFITLIALRDGLTLGRPPYHPRTEILLCSIHRTYQQGRNEEVFLFFILYPFLPEG